MPASAPAADNRIDEKDKKPAPQRLGMRDPIVDPANIPIQIIGLESMSVIIVSNF